MNGSTGCNEKYWLKNKTELCSRKIVKVYIQLRELNRYVNAAVMKTFLWRFWKEIFPAIYRLLTISGKIASKPQENRLFQTALLCVRSPSEVASMFRFSEVESRFF